MPMGDLSDSTKVSSRPVMSKTTPLGLAEQVLASSRSHCWVTAFFPSLDTL
jgi:hypothetical protein